MKKKIIILGILATAVLTGCTNPFTASRSAEAVVAEPGVDEVTDDTFSPDGVNGASGLDVADGSNVSSGAVVDDAVVDDGEGSDSSSSGDVSDDSEATEGVTEDELRALMDNNLYVIFNIYYYGNLAVAESPVDGSLYQVVDPEFPDYASLEAYLSSVYCAEYVSELLSQPTYVNRDGALYMDMSYATGGGYYTDWTDATFEITSSNDKQCTFTVTGSVQWPGEDTTEPYTAAGTVVYENGMWLLTTYIE